MDALNCQILVHLQPIHSLLQLCRSSENAHKSGVLIHTTQSIHKQFSLSNFSGDEF